MLNVLSQVHGERTLFTLFRDQAFLEKYKKEKNDQYNTISCANRTNTSSRRTYFLHPQQGSSLSRTRKERMIYIP